MELFAVTAAVQHHTEVAPTPAAGTAPITVANQLGGVAIIGVLALMMVVNASIARMQPKLTRQLKRGTTNTSYPLPINFNK